MPPLERVEEVRYLSLGADSRGEERPAPAPQLTPALARLDILGSSRAKGKSLQMVSFKSLNYGLKVTIS